MARRFPRHKAIALVTTLMMLPLMVLIGFSLTATGVTNMVHARHADLTTRAEYVSEAGIADGIEKVKGGTYSGSFNSPSISGSHDSYAFSLTQGAGTAPNGVAVPAGAIYIYSTGSVYPDGDTNKEVMSRSTGVMIKINSQFSWPYGMATIGGQHWEDLAAGDAYNSTLGSQNVAPAVAPGKAQVGSNGSNTFGAATLSGNLTLPMGGTIGGMSLTSGGTTIFKASPPVNAALLAITWPLTTPTASPWTGGTYHLSAGTYYWSNLQPNGGTLICDSGPVKIYIDRANTDAEAVHLMGGATILAPKNAQGYYSPKQLEILTAGGIHVEAGSTIYGTAIAQQQIHLEGSSHWYGAIASSYTGTEAIHIEGGATMTYDTQLASAGSPTYPVASWQRF